MTLETHQITGGIGIGIILLASVLTLLGLEGFFILIPPLLVCVGAGFLAHSFYMSKEKDADRSIGTASEIKLE